VRAVLCVCTIVGVVIYDIIISYHICISCIFIYKIPNSYDDEFYEFS
jgi:hypothetical protein